MKAKEMIIIVTCVLLGASILMVGCKEKNRQITQKMYESEYQRYDNRIPSELRNIVFKSQKKDMR